MTYPYRNCGDECEVSLRQHGNILVITRTDDNADGDSITVHDRHAWPIVQRAIEVQGGDIVDAFDVITDVAREYVAENTGITVTSDTFADIDVIVDLMLA